METGQNLGSAQQLMLWLMNGIRGGSVCDRDVEKGIREVTFEGLLGCVVNVHYSRE
jgi:hypothetical protein